MGGKNSKSKKNSTTSLPSSSSSSSSASSSSSSSGAVRNSSGAVSSSVLPSAAEQEQGDVVKINADSKTEFKDSDVQAAADGDSAYSFWDRNKTLIPERQLPAGSKASKLQHTMQATMKATLGGGDVQQTVKLPEGEDLNEWIAVNTVHFFNAASMIYGTCAEFCTEEACPSMTAGRAEYLWKDNKEFKKPTRIPAPKYIDFLLTWIDEQITNPAIFPVEEGQKFPRNFLTVAKNIYKRLFRLYAHIYCSHSEKIRSIGANAHLNTCFKHFVYFILEFQLLAKEDMAPLDKLIIKLKERDAEAKGDLTSPEPAAAAAGAGGDETKE